MLYNTDLGNLFGIANIRLECDSQSQTHQLTTVIDQSITAIIYIVSQ